MNCLKRAGDEHPPESPFDKGDLNLSPKKGRLRGVETPCRKFSDENILSL